MTRPQQTGLEVSIAKFKRDIDRATKSFIAALDRELSRR